MAKLPRRTGHSATAARTPLRRAKSVGDAVDAASPAAHIEALAGDPNFMTSLARGLAVVRGFSHERRQLTIAQLSTITGIPRAAVRRCLYTLTRLGYVTSADGRAHALQPKVLGLGHAYLSSTPLVVLAQPFLDRVSDTVQESCSLAVLDGDDILYLARSISSRIISVTLNVGSRLPAYCTSIGHVLLAHLTEDALESYLRRAHFHPYTERTITAPRQLRTALGEVRATGYAIADQQMELGVRSIAVPVRDGAGTVLAGINVITQAGRGNGREMKARFLPHLQAAARDLGAQLLG